MAEGVPPQGTGFKPAEQPVKHLDMGAFAASLEQNGKHEDAARIRENIQEQQADEQGKGNAQEFDLKSVAAELRRLGQHLQADEIFKRIAEQNQQEKSGS